MDAGWNVSSPEGVAAEATQVLPQVEHTAQVRIDANSTLDFSNWAMGASGDVAEPMEGGILSQHCLSLALASQAASSVERSSDRSQKQAADAWSFCTTLITIQDYPIHFLPGLSPSFDTTMQFMR